MILPWLLCGTMVSVLRFGLSSYAFSVEQLVRRFGGPLVFIFDATKLRVYLTHSKRQQPLFLRSTFRSLA